MKVCRGEEWKVEGVRVHVRSGEINENLQGWREWNISVKSGGMNKKKRVEWCRYIAIILNNILLVR